MQYWVRYDIADDRRRQRLSEALPDFGKRVEESAFHCHIEQALAEKMLRRVEAIIEAHTDKVHVLSLWDACGARTTVYGIATKAIAEYLIV